MLADAPPATAHPTTPTASPSPTPPSPTPPSPTLPTAAPLDPEASARPLVQKRYEEFYRVIAQAGAIPNPDDPRLAQYATGRVLANLRGRWAVHRLHGRRLYGLSVPHVSAVMVRGGRATVFDCLDNSRTGLLDKEGTKLNVGRARQQTTATLVLEARTWKLAEISTVAGGGSC